MGNCFLNQSQQRPVMTEFNSICHRCNTSAAQAAVKSAFGIKGWEKLLEICLRTVIAILKVHPFRIVNAISLLHKRISRFGRRFYEPERAFAAHLLTASDNKTNPFGWLLQQKKKGKETYARTVGGNQWLTIHVSYRKAVGS